MERRIAAFVFDVRITDTQVNIFGRYGIGKKAFISFLEKMPDDLHIVGCTFDASINAYKIFFESDEFDVVHESEVVPELLAILKHDENENVWCHEIHYKNKKIYENC